MGTRKYGDDKEAPQKPKSFHIIDSRRPYMLSGNHFFRNQEGEFFNMPQNLDVFY